MGVHNTDYLVDDVCDPSVGFRQPSSLAHSGSGWETKPQVVKSRRRDSSLGGDTAPRFGESPTPPRSVVVSQDPSASASEEKNERISRYPPLLPPPAS